MARMTKTQMKRMCRDISSKSKKLFMTEPDSSTGQIMSTKDFGAIEAIVKRCLNRLK